MSSSTWAIFCSQDSVSATTWEMWHLSGMVAKTGRVVSKSTYRVEPTVSYGRRIGFRVVRAGSPSRWPGRSGPQRRWANSVSRSSCGKVLSLRMTHSVKPALGDGEQLGEQPGSCRCPLRLGSNVPGSPWPAGTRLRWSGASSDHRVYGCSMSPTMGAIVGLGGDVRSGKRQLGVLGEGRHRCGHPRCRSGSPSGGER